MSSLYTYTLIENDHPKNEHYNQNEPKDITNKKMTQDVLYY